MATSSASLDRSPKKNWVEELGGLPPYVRKVARAIERERGIPLNRAIAIAIDRMGYWKGKAKTAATRTKAAAGDAAWTALKGKAAAARGMRQAAGDEAAEAGFILEGLELDPPTAEELEQVGDIAPLFEMADAELALEEAARFRAEAGATRDREAWVEAGAQEEQGFRLLEAAVTKDAEKTKKPLICPKCGKKNKMADDECKRCGHKLARARRALASKMRHNGALQEAGRRGDARGSERRQPDDASFERQHPRGKAGTPRGGQFVSKGSTGDDVKAIQKAVGAKEDGDFGAKTEQSVRQYQRRNGLKVDGIVGAQTAAAVAGKKAKPGALTDGARRQLRGGAKS